MEFLAELWLPILLAAVFVFIISSVLHMVIPLHKGDYGKLGGEDAILDSIRAQNVRPGTYMFPSCGSMKEMNTPEMRAKYDRGPVGIMTILPSGSPRIGVNLLVWFLYSILVSLFVAYIAWHGVSPGVEYLEVFRITGASAILAYAASPIVDSIWKGQRWSTTGKFIFDGVLYALATAGTFGWLWPEAA